MIGNKKPMDSKKLKLPPGCYEDALNYLYAYQNGTESLPPHSFDFTDELAGFFESALLMVIAFSNGESCGDDGK